MSDESAERLYVRTVRPPWREIISHRWSAARDWSLVLRDTEGAYFVLGHRGDPDDTGAHLPVPDEAAAPATGGSYTDVFRVDVTEHVDTRAIGLPTVYGTESVDLWVAWWVHDPVRVVRTRTVHGWHVVRTRLTAVLRDLAEAQTVAGNGLGAPEIMQHLGIPQRVEETGLSYRVFDVRLRETGEELLLGQQENEGVRYSWTTSRRGEYEFCLQALHAGPVSLAALWLLRHPDQVRQVLDWSVDHQDLLSPPRSDWQEELAVLLGTLTDQERKEISYILRDRISALGRQVPGMSN
ncbi:hypothetical protein SAMN04487983_1002301 [Streptomyces sp. yr375]|uniref:hypothetical protein n=1 Tax=Streptomyces sp. yr375 TaxID=1761906 RepID=UPI0008C29B5E|nr:hypothetical protein [Streptomyces sp. yr375]SEP97062.1 hypothetical protein SAMN04487983_1002301 [Streptomyces sp. yr375]